MIKSKERIEMAENAGIGMTSGLIYMAAHDMFGFSKKRFLKMEADADRYSKIAAAGKKLEEFSDELQEAGMKYQSWVDFNRRMAKAIDAHGKIEIGPSKTATSYTYIFLLFSLHDTFGFGKKRLRAIQDKVMSYIWLIINNEVMALEFLKCLKVECKMNYPVVDRYEKMCGEIKIYG
jgi:hypothetical protein